MNKKVWKKYIGKNSMLRVFRDGVILNDNCEGDSRISYTEQSIDIFKKGTLGYNEYCMLMLKGVIWGPGTLTQMSDMTLRFVMK